MIRQHNCGVAFGRWSESAARTRAISLQRTQCKPAPTFVGYAKVCAQEPESVWTANSVEKLTSASGCKSELEAVLAAEQKARQAIAEISPGWDTTSLPGALN